MAVPVGLNVWSRLVDTTFPYFDRTVAAFDSLWLPDHVQYGSHNVAEGWTLLVWALARYPDKLAGHEVLCNSFRNPAHTAKMVATAQALSGGRVIFGIGAGWNKEEYLAYGWPYPPTPVRIAQMGEAITLIRRMWTDAPATYEGEHWNYGFRDAALYTHKQEILRGHCRELGRDYDRIVQVIRVGILIAETEREVERLKTAPGVRPMTDIRLAGTPAQVTDALQAIIKQGAGRLTVNFADAPRPDGTLLFAKQVLPNL
jgi:alkanesulfonate monooxygenase SsuD/methylene tetrahydromethanopterin reductase-like flavin-dependent oxidoreductase (luciferase family)